MVFGGYLCDVQMVCGESRCDLPPSFLANAFKCTGGFLDVPPNLPGNNLEAFLKYT